MTEQLSGILFLFALSFIPAGFSYLLDFCLGHPGDSPDDNGKGGVNPHAIFFKWTLWLSERRLKQVDPEGLAELKLMGSGLIGEKDKLLRETNYKKTVVEEARQFFKWEFAAGMCIFCTNVYIAFLFGIWFMTIVSIPGIGFFIPIATIIFSHGISRKLKAK